ncbi:MAG: hemolysin family protein [Paracoccaceae bacterium]
MNTTTDSPAPEAGAGDTPEGPGQRGLIGRLLNAFTPAGTADSAVRTPPDNPAPADTPAAVSHGLGNLRRLRVDDVAIPKAEIVAVPVTIPLDDLVKTFRDSGFSRLPVYKGTLDGPLGLIHLKDLALQQAFSDPKPRYSLRKMLRPLLFAPPSMPLGVLLQKMQSGRIHMALVIDEYGGVDGLVTIEDLLEQVVGEIEDEHDTSEAGLWLLEKPGQYLVQARVPLDEFEIEIGRTLAADGEGEDVDTLGGLVTMISGRVPARGEVIPHDSGIEFEVVDADPRRIKRLRVRLPQPKP